MFPRAVRLSISNALLVPSSQRIRAKSEIFVSKPMRAFVNTSSDAHVASSAHLGVEMGVQEDVGWLEVEVWDRGVHAVEEVHAHRDLVNHLELLGPHQRVAGQEVVERAVAHVLHHHGGGFAARSIDGHNVFEFEFGYFGHLFYDFPGGEKLKLKLKSTSLPHFC